MSGEKTKQELGADGFPIDVESEEEESCDIPFNPDHISIESRVVPMDTLIRRLRQGTINLAPNFQRDFIWSFKQRSRLIESLMLKIPLPMFYVAATPEGKWDVVDGVQRLSTIKAFILNEKRDGEVFRLSDLEFWGSSFNGKTYQDIEKDSQFTRIVNTIMETELRFTIINPGTPEPVKRNIFKRINTGGMPLTSQEIRHALYQGRSTEFLAHLVIMPSFTKVIGTSLNDSRMAIRELVLRFLAFSLRSATSYDPTMDDFLSDTMRLINRMPDLTDAVIKKILQDKRVQTIHPFTLEQLEARFNTAMQRGVALFGEHAFRKSCEGDDGRSLINKPLFESLGNVLADLEEQACERLENRRSRLHEQYRKLIQDNEFSLYIGRRSTAVKGVEGRYRMLREMIRGVLEGGPS